ncbi:MAG: 2-oxo acid dehydrogenase subunit E2 [Ignavibacteria bacterium]|nr:2-oxo acid dehydrogenase subunit E2 [Ignavibacteria bacterium]MBK7445531.1 2-oxo acid dehydrogenase subunit E2 [Ignavibacteria bacterium]MBK9403399.1 2-oxo acid dehydrogenase subunit E2 [Ignavibacteria bacterium]MBL0108613.1 2-oxo acid dehydrogenase subunit E2 [Ignavibacteria bacterium]
MIKEVKLPEVSDNVETGDVVKILVSIGDKIKIDQPVIELETDKAMFEVPSTEEGTVKEINVKEGQSIQIGSVILKLETNGAENVKDNKADAKAEVKKQDEPIKEKKDEDVLNKIEDKNITYTEKEAAITIVRSEDTVPYNVKRESAPATPSVRRLARELGVDIDRVSGSGQGGRIMEEDVKNFVKIKLTSTDAGNPVSQKQLPDFKKWGDVEIQSMNKVRVITAEAMTYAWSTIPMVTQSDKADITELEEFRKKYSKSVEEKGGHLTLTSMLVKVCSAALNKFPQFNSSIDLNKKEIIFKKYFNIGIAVDTDRGLLVPVIKNTDKKSITEISVELNELAEKARTKKITPDEMDGGNFTISNLGGIGGTHFNPIVYSPQVAILGVSRGSKEAVYIDGIFEPRLMLPVSLTYDHRIIDGADAARFLRWIAEALENPMMMNL